jgi:hypothetical protein
MVSRRQEGEDCACVDYTQNTCKQQSYFMNDLWVYEWRIDGSRELCKLPNGRALGAKSILIDRQTPFMGTRTRV